MHAIVGYIPTKWAKCLPWAELWCNTTVHTSTGTSPFQAVYGRIPPILSNYIPHSTHIPQLEYWAVSRDHLLQTFKTNLQKAQHRMKTLADTHRSDKEFEVGTWAFLKLRPYRQTTICNNHHKLSKKYYGPFQIIERIGPVAYKLLLPLDSRTHPIFHISLLKLCPNHNAVPQQPMPQANVSYDLEDKVDLERVSIDAPDIEHAAAPREPRTRPKRTLRPPRRLLDGCEGLDDTKYVVFRYFSFFYFLGYFLLAFYCNLLEKQWSLRCHIGKVVRGLLATIL